MENIYNLYAYDEVEKFQLSLNENDIKAYLNDKLLSAKDNADFIKKHVLADSKKKISVCELGTGNGKLLYTLKKDNVIAGGDGFEISKSRCELAAKFKEMLEVQDINIINDNFLNVTPNIKYDLVICIDQLIHMIGALHKNSEEEMLQWIDQSLRPNGYVLIEICDYTKALAAIKEEGGEQRYWVEFSEHDPYRYGLHHITLAEDGCFVFKKTHIKRDGEIIEGAKIAMHPYPISKLKTWLTLNGYEYKLYPVATDDGESKLVKSYRCLARKCR